MEDEYLYGHHVYTLVFSNDEGKTERVGGFAVRKDEAGKLVVNLLE